MASSSFVMSMGLALTHGERIHAFPNGLPPDPGTPDKLCPNKKCILLERFYIDVGHFSFNYLSKLEFPWPNLDLLMHKLRIVLLANSLSTDNHLFVFSYTLGREINS